jgi:hypothetical protein
LGVFWGVLDRILGIYIGKWGFYIGKWGILSDFRGFGGILHRESGYFEEFK